jgi:hypothetical protein
MPNAEASKPRRRLPRWAKVCIGVVACLVAVTVVPRLYIAIQLHREYAAIRKAGYPVTLKELEQWYNAQPIGENAADVYLEAFGKLVSTEEAEGLSVPVRFSPSPGLTPNTKACMAQYLAKNSEALKLLHRAATMRDCRFPFRTRPWLGGGRNNAEAVDRCTRLLELEAILEAEDARSEGVFAALDALHGMVRALRMAPFLDEREMSWDHCALVVALCLGNIRFTDAQLQALSRRFEEAEDPVHMTRALIGLRCQGAHDIRTWSARRLPFGVENPRLDRTLTIAYWVCGLREQDELAFLHCVDRHIQWSSLPFPERWRHVQAAVTPFVEERKHVTMQPMAHQVMAEVSGFIYWRTLEPAGLRLARTALALERYRLAQGALPDSLDQLVPQYADAIPADPFDGQPIRYKLLDKGYAVYSVGWNESDDGGGADDLLFTVER